MLPSAQDSMPFYAAKHSCCIVEACWITGIFQRGVSSEDAVAKTGERQWGCGWTDAVGSSAKLSTAEGIALITLQSA